MIAYRLLNSLIDMTNWSIDLMWW